MKIIRHNEGSDNWEHIFDYGTYRTDVCGLKREAPRLIFAGSLSPIVK